MTSGGNLNVRSKELSVSGCLQTGVNLGMGVSSLAESCTVSQCGSSGVVADVVSNCSAWTCFAGVVSNVATNCYANTVGGSGDAINATRATDCIGYANSGIGVHVLRDAVNCLGTSTNGTGISAGENVVSSTGFGQLGGITGQNVSGCTASSNSGFGISAHVVTKCSVTQGSASAISAVTASDCYAYCISGLNALVVTNGTNCYASCDGATATVVVNYGGTLVGCNVISTSATAIQASDYSSISGCSVGAGSAGNGIVAGNGCSVTGCAVRTLGGDGLVAGSNCYVAHNTMNSLINAGSGVHITGNSNCIEGNEAIGYNYGIRVDSTGNVVFANRTRGNAVANFNIVTGNRVSTITTPANSAGPILGNVGGTTFSTDSFTNIAY
jgi:hypothetical protein